MTFTRSQSPVIHCYFVGSSNIMRVYDTILGLDLKFNTSLDSKPHIGMICYKAFKVFGFININENSFGL